MISAGHGYNPVQRESLSPYIEDEYSPPMSSPHSAIGVGIRLVPSNASSNHSRASNPVHLEEMPPMSRRSTRHSTRSAVGLGIVRPIDVESATQFGVEDRERTRANSLASSIGASDAERRQKAKNSSPLSRTSFPQSPESPDSPECPQPPPPPPPFQARFWSKDPVTSIKRKIYIKVIGSSLVLITLAIFGLLSIYWASLYDSPHYAHGLEGWVIDFDGGSIGQTVIQAFQNSTGLPRQISWKVVETSQFPNFPQDVQDAVINDKTWAAISINPGSSDNLDNAIANADGLYNGSLVVTAYVNEARNNNGYSAFIRPQILAAMSNAVRIFAIQNTQQILANTSVDLNTLLSQAPSVVTNPLYYTIDNLRPFDVPLATALQLVGLIYVLIISFIVCMTNYQARVLISGLNQHLSLTSLLGLRIIAPFLLYFFVSLFFSLLSLAFQAPFSRYFGEAGFVIYWMMNWAGMLSLGLAMESMITILTPAFIPYFLILWIISNVSVISLPIEVLPDVFYYGYATPFFNISQTVKTILFNTKDQIGLNFGVQFAWIFISILTMTTFTILMRKKEECEWLKKQHKAGSNDQEKV